MTHSDFFKPVRYTESTQTIYLLQLQKAERMAYRFKEQVQKRNFKACGIYQYEMLKVGIENPCLILELNQLYLDTIASMSEEDRVWLRGQKKQEYQP